MNNPADRIRRKINSLAKEYMKKGYEVYFEPRGDKFPQFLKNYIPDLIVCGHGENVVIEVKSSKALINDKKIEQLANIISEYPGWRFDLVITNPRSKLDYPSNSQLYKYSEIYERYNKSMEFINDNDLESSILVFWGMAEAFFRILGKRYDLSFDGKSTLYMLKKLYSISLLNKSLYNHLKEAMNMRNAISHGFKVEKIDTSSFKKLIWDFRILIDNNQRPNSL